MEIVITNQKNEIVANVKINEEVSVNVIWDKDYKVLIDGTYQEIKD